MTLKRAIARLRPYLRWRKPDPADDFYEAVQLGFEALKRERHHRHLDIDTRFGLLPGETEK